MHHRVINGRIYRDVTLEAADTRESSRHISAQRPLSFAEQRAFRRMVGAER